MTTISSPMPFSIPTQKLGNLEGLTTLTGSETQTMSTQAPGQQVSIKDAVDITVPRTQDKPLLKLPEQTTVSPSLLFEVKNMNKVELEETSKVIGGFSSAYANLQEHIAVTAIKVEKAVREVITEENSKLEKMFPTIANLDESEIKQLSQGVNLMLAASAIKDVQVAQANSEDVKPGIQSLDAIKESQFIGIMSSDILMELRNLLSQIKSIINTADRQLQADFLKLKTQMVQSAADTTIQEGKKAFEGALMGFAVSLGVTLAGAALQTKQLVKQTKAINVHGVERHKLSTQAQSEIESSRPYMKKTGNKALEQQNELHVTNVQDKVKGLQLKAEREQLQLDRITNQTQKKSSIIETMTRLSDNAGQLVTSALNIEVKALEAQKMVLQDIGDTARAIASDKEKQIDTVLDLMKKVFDILKEIIEGQIRTFQAVATRG
ncbi:hypothetical protein L3033_001596 [Providencia stuartii]|nr:MULTISPECIES: hypothetical protein [Providencia]MCR4080583.1 hypothetical protein [Providencia stuartii]MDN0019445.1 hypothetical protein [Providencia stuartii]MTC80836.1 hypothetical protein [Providencia stuartii]MTC93107.1 hypothetical protein [Providencia stuartii]HEM8879045.1 hypothetical protein [Providencia stuartii]